MQTYAEIKHLVQEVLGCSCPEEVFNKIDYQRKRAPFPERKVTVGGRLLIYFIDMDRESNIQEDVESALWRGVEERDKEGLNRFRLVLVASRPEKIYSQAEHVFNDAEYTDEKTHLHVVSKNCVEGF
jgi:hypothetical protein